MTITATEAADLFRSAPDRMIDVGNGQVAVRTAGTGPDVLFVHGWPVSGATYRTVMPFLTPHVTCHVIDLVGSGSSGFDAETPVSIDGHVAAVRRVVDELGVTDLAVVGHDSGGMIARHALAGDPRIRSMVMIDTEQPAGLTWRFKSFLLGRHLPGYGRVLGWLVGRPRLRRLPLVFGDAFCRPVVARGRVRRISSSSRCTTDPVPLATPPSRSCSTRSTLRLRSTSSSDIHRRIDVPVQARVGCQGSVLPGQAAARAMVDDPRRMRRLDGARRASSLFSHEERPAEAAAAILETVG